MESDGAHSKRGNIFHRFCKKRKEKSKENEIRMLVGTERELGTIEPGQREMIENVLEFRDITVKEVMTHRVDIIAVEEGQTIADVIDLALNEGFTRIPVYKKIIDDIIGVIYVKDLLCLIGEDSPGKCGLQSFIREVFYVPESARCRDLFKQFTERHRHIAIVIDEYGGTSGLVTLENLLEAIVGEIQDEYDDEAEEMVAVNATTYVIEGSADLEEVAKKLEIDFESSKDVDTINGFLIDRLGRIPEEGEHPVIQYKDVEFTVLSVSDRSIQKIRAVKNLESQTEDV